MQAFFSTQNRTEHFYFKQKHENVYNIVQRIYTCTSFFYNKLATLFSGHTVQHPPLPLVAPFTKSTEEEINKQINRELFAHYTYLSMVSFYKAFLGFKAFLTSPSFSFSQQSSSKILLCLNYFILFFTWYPGHAFRP